MRSWFVLVLVLAAALPARAQGVGVDERVGDRLPLELRVTDQRGQERALGELIGAGQGKPVLLSLAYYHCPGLCDVSLRELANRLRDLGWKLGSDYRALTLSIDPHDTPATAAAKRSNVVTLLHAAVGDEWPFAVASASSIQQLTAALGYRYTYDAPAEQYAHPAASVVLTPDGVISRYVYGPTVAAGTLRLALREARAGRGGVSSLIDRTVLSCFRYDPTTRRYEWLVTGVMRIGSALIACGLLIAILIFQRRGRQREAAS